MEQEIQNVGNTLESMVDTYQQYFENFLPGLAGFGIKVVIALLVFVGGRKVIQCHDEASAPDPCGGDRRCQRNL